MSVPGPELKSPTRTTGIVVAVGPATSWVACGLRICDENASRCVVTKRNERPSIVTSTEAQPRGSVSGPAAVGTVSAAA